MTTEHRLWHTRSVNCDTRALFPLGGVPMTEEARKAVYAFEIQSAYLHNNALTFSNWRTDDRAPPVVAAAQYLFPVFLEFVARCFGRLSQDLEWLEKGWRELIESTEDPTTKSDHQMKFAQLIADKKAGNKLFLFHETLQTAQAAAEIAIYGYRFWFFNHEGVVDGHQAWKDMVVESEKSRSSKDHADLPWKKNLRDQVEYHKNVARLNNITEGGSETLTGITHPKSPCHPNQCFGFLPLVNRVDARPGCKLATVQRQVQSYFDFDEQTFDPPRRELMYRIDTAEVLAGNIPAKLLPGVQAEMAMSDIILCILEFDSTATGAGASDEEEEEQSSSSEDDDLIRLLNIQQMKKACELLGVDNEVYINDDVHQPTAEEEAAAPSGNTLKFVNGGNYSQEAQKHMNPYTPLHDQGEELMKNVRAFCVDEQSPFTREQKDVLARWQTIKVNNRQARVYAVHARSADNPTMSAPMVGVHSARDHGQLYAAKNAFTLQHRDHEMSLFCNWEAKRLLEYLVGFKSCNSCLLDLWLKYRFDAFNCDCGRTHQHSMQVSYCGGTGKSFIFKIIIWCSITDTAYVVAYNSEKSFADCNQNQHDRAIFRHEGSETALMDQQSPAHALLKMQLADNTQSYQILQVMDKEPYRKSITGKVNMVSVVFIARNSDGKRQIPPAMKSRFHIAFVPEKPEQLKKLIKLYLSEISQGSIYQDQMKTQLMAKHQTLQGIVAELEKMIHSRALCEVSTHLAGIFFSFVLNKLFAAHPSKQNVRAYERAVTLARVNAITDAIAKVWFYEGAPLAGQDIDLNAGRPFLERFFFVGLDHCIAALGDLLQLFFNSWLTTFAQAMPRLTRARIDKEFDGTIVTPPPDHYKPHNGDHYIWFYKREDLAKTLLWIVHNKTDKENAIPVTMADFNMLYDSNIVIQSPNQMTPDPPIPGDPAANIGARNTPRQVAAASAQATKRALRLYPGNNNNNNNSAVDDDEANYTGSFTSLPLFTKFQTDHKDLVPLTENKSGVLYGIAVHFGAKTWAEDPEVLTDTFITQFLNHKHQLPGKYTCRPDSQVACLKKTITFPGPDVDAPSFRFPTQASYADSLIASLPEYAHLLKKIYGDTGGTLNTDFESWALRTHNAELQIAPANKIPAKTVTTTRVIERAFNNLHRQQSGVSSAAFAHLHPRFAAALDPVQQVYFAGTNLSLYRETVKENRSHAEYRLLYDDVTGQVLRKSAALKPEDDYDFPDRFVFIESKKRYVWEFEEFAPWQIRITPADSRPELLQQAPTSPFESPTFYLVDEFPLNDAWHEHAFQHNVACMKIFFVHSKIYAAILQVRLRFAPGSANEDRTSQTYPETWLNMKLLDDDDEQEAPLEEEEEEVYGDIQRKRRRGSPANESSRKRPRRQENPFYEDNDGDFASIAATVFVGQPLR